MSKREHTTSQSYVDWLKSLGCLVYLPLLANGDLQDRISGLPLQFTGNGSLVWDANQQMYQLTTPSQYNSHIATLNNGISVANFPDNKFTFLGKYKKITNSLSKFIRGFCVNSYDGTTTDTFNCLYNGSSRTSTYPIDITAIGGVYNSNIERSFYQNGTLFVTAASDTRYLPSNWILNGPGVILGNTTYTSSFTSVQYYVSELYLFNTALDLQTIRKIQGYE